MSPTLSELQDVLDWEAVVVLRAIDDAQGASVATVTETAGLNHDTVTDRCQQLSTLGLITEAEGGEVYEVTGMGHGAIGEGLYDEYQMVGEADIDELATEVASLLDRRETIESELERLREDAAEVRARARTQFGDREDVAAEFESLQAEIDGLADRLAE